MNNFYEEYIGFESILPNEIIDLLNRYQSRKNKRCQLYIFMKDNVASPLDEHELAMAE